MTIPRTSRSYAVAVGTASNSISVPVYALVDPTIYAIQYPIGKRWINTVSNNAFELTSFVSSGGSVTAVWTATGGSSGTFSSLTVTGSGTFGTGVTATTGNITASAGNLVSGGAGNGLVLPVVVVAAGGSPQVANGRAVQVTFSGVSIATAATQSFTITDSAITSSSTNLHISWWGATTGSALNIQSVTPGSGTVAIVMENGTGASTSTANITFSVLVLD